MIKSMTGYGRHQEIVNGREITVEIRSVNHRYYEFSAKVPRVYGYLEEKLKSYLKGKISRGKVDVLVTIFNIEAEEEHIEVNKTVALEYINALRDVNAELGLHDDLTLSKIMRLPDVFTVKKVGALEDEIWANVKTVAETAVDNFVKMREVEGVKMREDILFRLENISKYTEFVESKQPEIVEKYREKLYNKISEVLDGKNIDECRIVTEAAIFSEKIAVDEETVRLKSHIEQCKELLLCDEAVGRKLDFLIQEFNREANTTGSKSTSLEITNTVVNIKAEIEKIREQVQNIE